MIQERIQHSSLASTYMCTYVHAPSPNVYTYAQEKNLKSMKEKIEITLAKIIRNVEIN